MQFLLITTKRGKEPHLPHHLFRTEPKLLVMLFYVAINICLIIFPFLSAWLISRGFASLPYSSAQTLHLCFCGQCKVNLKGENPTGSACVKCKSRLVKCSFNSMLFKNAAWLPGDQSQCSHMFAEISSACMRWPWAETLYTRHWY